MQYGAVTYCYAVADKCRVLVRDVKQAPVLDIGVRTDLDFVDVGANDCVEPNAGSVADGCPANDYSCWSDKNRVRNDWIVVFKWKLHRLFSLA